MTSKYRWVYANSISVSNSYNDPLAICKKCSVSFFVLRPMPSAMFDGTDIDALSICARRIYLSSCGKTYTIGMLNPQVRGRVSKPLIPCMHSTFFRESKEGGKGQPGINSRKTPIFTVFFLSAIPHSRDFASLNLSVFLPSAICHLPSTNHGNFLNTVNFSSSSRNTKTMAARARG